MLRAALSLSQGAEAWVLRDPRIWLGTAFHRLMASFPQDELEAKCIWDREIGRLLTEASAHRLNKRFARPERWPGYFLVRQRAITSATRNTSARPAAAPSEKADSALQGIEKLLTARHGRLIGRPDHFDFQVVTEYKSTLPDPRWQEAETILDGYWRQLRLYAVLIAEMGRWPVTARIVSASGHSLEQDINRKDCDAEADAAVTSLEIMTKLFERGGNSKALANPGVDSCGQCPYQAICPAFWSWCRASSWPQLREPAARGIVESVDKGQDGDLYAVVLRLDGRYGENGTQSLALKKSVHGDLTLRGAGTQIRMVSASVRPDGRLRADISTCVYVEDELPKLECASLADRSPF